MRAHWAWTTFRILSTITAVLVFDQAVFAGQFLAGSFDALHTHQDNARYAALGALATAVAGLLVRWRGGGPWWPAATGAGLFALIAAQIALGFARLLTVHIPLGVTIIALTVAGCVRGWRTPRSRPGNTQPGHTQPGHTQPGGTQPGNIGPGGTEPGAAGQEAPGPGVPVSTGIDAGARRP